MVLLRITISFAGNVESAVRYRLCVNPKPLALPPFFSMMFPSISILSGAPSTPNELFLMSEFFKVTSLEIEVSETRLMLSVRPVVDPHALDELRRRLRYCGADVEVEGERARLWLPRA